MPTLHFKGKSVIRTYHLTLPYRQLTSDLARSLTEQPGLRDNLIIQSDNLLALKALLPTFSGKIKCIYIDPPYNTGNEKWVYNDAVNSPAHQDWFKQVFDSLLQSGELRFYLISGCAGSAVPDRIKAKAGARKLTTATGDLPARTLFDYFLEEDFNDLEKAVALHLDQQEGILEWWCRNNVGPNSYSIQGWRRHRPHLDFFALRKEPPTVYVLETKGIHLGSNPDTNYKKQLFELCNKHSQPTPWNEIAQEFSGYKVNFQVVFEDEWQRVLNAMLASSE